MSRRPLITLALVGTATIASASLATVTARAGFRGGEPGVRSEQEHHVADQARGRAVPGERLL